MKTKIIQFVPAALTFIAVGFRHFSLWCTNSGHLCYRTWVDRLFLDMINPVYFFCLFFLPIAIILIFVPRAIFNSWLKLAVWVVPLSIICIATTPINHTGLGLDFFPFYRDDAARLAGQTFAILSFLLIAWKYVALKRASANGVKN